MDYSCRVDRQGRKPPRLRSRPAVPDRLFFHV